MDITKYLFTANSDISQIIEGLCLINPKNVILSYLNVNSVRNTFDNLPEIIKQNVDVLADVSFPSVHLFLQGYHRH